MSVKGACGLKKRLILVAYGMDEQGNREFLGFLLAEGESEAPWSVLLQSLYARGLKGEALQLVITDAAPGLLAAARMVYPHAQHQRCWFHKLQNVIGCVRKADKKEVTKGVQAIYLADTRRDAIAAYPHGGRSLALPHSWKQRWQSLYPKAVVCLEKDLGALLGCFDFPAQLRSKIRTTNYSAPGRTLHCHRARLPRSAPPHSAHGRFHQ